MFTILLMHAATGTGLRKAICCLVLLCCLLAGGACRPAAEQPRCSGTQLVFKHGRVGDKAGTIGRLLAEFEAANPGLCVREEELPSSTDEQHQFYVVNLESRSHAFDVYALDVIWLQAFARAGWLKALDGGNDAAIRGKFFGPAIEAATFEGRLFALPWFVDAGMLYYRRDLLDKYGFRPPSSWEELLETAAAITGREPGVYGFVWQGKQYEGLVCNMLEFIWSGGGAVLRDGKSALASEESVAALKFVRRLIESGVTPSFVTTLNEEASRQIFGSGRAVFMRNWPYAWRVFQQQQWAVSGKTGLAALPAFGGGNSAPALGGWHLGVNTYSRHPAEALKLLRFLSSSHAQKTVALSIGYQPAIKSLYQDTELLARQPWLSQFYEIMQHARPRPLTPYYMMISQILQPEFSAVVSGLRAPSGALEAAGRRIDFILGESGR